MPVMNHIKLYPAKLANSSAGNVLECPDDVGELNSEIYFSTFGRIYRLGCLEIGSLVIRLKRSLVILDMKRASAFLITDSNIFSFYVEDVSWVLFEDYVILYSDSSLVFLNDTGAREVNFLLLNEYHINIDFSKLSEGNILFEMGSSEVVCRSIEGLNQEIGRDLKPEVPKLGKIDRGAKIYDLSADP